MHMLVQHKVDWRFFQCLPDLVSHVVGPLVAILLTSAPVALELLSSPGHFVLN